MLRVVCFADSSAPLTELISTRGRHNSRIGEHQLSFREQTAGKRDVTKARLSRVPGPLDKTVKGDVDYVRLRNSQLENALVLSAAVEKQRRPLCRRFHRHRYGRSAALVDSGSVASQGDRTIPLQPCVF